VRDERPPHKAARKRSGAERRRPIRAGVRVEVRVELRDAIFIVIGYLPGFTLCSCRERCG
jgi:hypothetical protein